MITRLWAGVRKPGLTRADFQRHWRGVHASFGLALPGLRAYVQNHVVTPEEWGPISPALDGCSELDFDDVAAMREAFSSPAMQNADRDERAFADPDRFAVVVAERRVVRSTDVADAPSRVLTFLRVNQRTEVARLVSTLEGDYADILRDAAAVRHELLIAVEDAGEPQACDVVDSAWFESHAAASAALRRSGDDLSAALAGFAFGREIALVAPHRLK